MTCSIRRRPTSIKSTLFPTIQADNCPVSILPLTSVKAQHGTLISKIEAMKPTGTTNVTIGLAWGWHALTPNAPLTEGTAPDPETDKVIILLTDGENTENRWTTNSADIDARTRKVCANVKAAGIKLYTVRVIDGNATLLQQCATRSDMYFNVQNATQLNAVFTPDRQEPREPAHRQIIRATYAQSESPASRPGFLFHWNATTILALNCARSKLSRSSRSPGLPSSGRRPAAGTSC